MNGAKWYSFTQNDTFNVEMSIFIYYIAYIYSDTHVTYYLFMQVLPNIIYKIFHIVCLPFD